MIVPRHRICDICSEPVGINKRYYIIKSKCLIQCYAGSFNDNRKHHICEDCMNAIVKQIQGSMKPTNTKEVDANGE